MKFHALLAIAGMLATPLHAQELSPADREALLGRLEKLRESVAARTKERFSLALAAYRNAMASDDNVREFYLDCVEKVDFTDQRKKTSEFRAWKRHNADQLATSGMALALRLQLSWLMLSLRAASEKSETDRGAIATDAREIIDAIVREAAKLKPHQGLLNQPATSSVFARAYDIGDVRLDNWPPAPGNIGQVYDQIILPPLRQQRLTEELRAAWTRRIQQEISLRDNPAPVSENGSRKIGMASAMRTPEYEQFMAETVPELQWRMEVDLFRHGDERGAAMRMLAHLEKNLTHKSVRDWGEQFVQLISQQQADEPASD